MKELLDDAAFFSEWITLFFWDDKDWQSWSKNSSKYIITKPVDSVMNSILQGEDFESAFAKFLSFLKENISSDKTKEESKAKVDVNDLEEFVKKSREIFMSYYNLRKKNISKFIKAKNGLRSAIYIFKRYKNLKEVLK